MKKVFLSIVMFLFLIAISGCWAGEVTVETKFNADGSGYRLFILDVIDEDLADGLIPNPEDPDQNKEKGPVLNNQHVQGGVVAIQNWLVNNAPNFITVLDPKVEGYHRYFTLRMDFSSFNDFLDKYEKLVNLSPTLNWDVFGKDEIPQFTSKGFFAKSMKFTESKEILQASMDWAIDGIYNDIWQEGSLAGFGVGKADIVVFANYIIEAGDGKYEELQHYDVTKPDGDYMGKIVYIQSEEFNVEGKETNITAIVLTIIGGIVLIGGAVAVVLVLKKKKA